MPVELVLRHIQRLRAAVSVWPAARWSAAPRPLPGLLATSTTCAGVAGHLVQVLADLAADAEGRDRRPVPKPDTDLALADQLAVMAHDLALAEPAEHLVRAALAEVLLHRAEIDSARPAADAIEVVLGRPAAPAELLRAAAAACPARQRR